MIGEIKDLNQNAESSRALAGKTVQDLDKKAVKNLFKTKLTKDYFLKHSIKSNAPIDKKLKELYLMSNGYVIKGTFLCLCAASDVKSINTMADYVSFGVYESKDRTLIKIANEFYGNLVMQFEQIENEVKLALGSPQIIDLLERIADYAIPSFVIRELIANAIVHRDYSENAKIHTTIELYADRLVVLNAGKFPDHINLDDIENIQSKPINKEIARVFFLHGIVQKKGSGIQRVQNILAERGMKPAIFEQKEGIVKVTVYKKTEQGLGEHVSLRNEYQKLTKSFEEIGNYEKAVEYYIKLLNIQEKEKPINSLALATSYNNLSVAYYRLGNWDTAIYFGQKALAIYKKQDSQYLLNCAITYNNLATVYSFQRNWEKAINYGQTAIQIALNILAVEPAYIKQFVETQSNILIDAIALHGANPFQANIVWFVENCNKYLN